MLFLLLVNQRQLLVIDELDLGIVVLLPLEYVIDGLEVFNESLCREVFTKRDFHGGHLLHADFILNRRSNKRDNFISQLQIDVRTLLIQVDKAWLGL